MLVASNLMHDLALLVEDGETIVVQGLNSVRRHVDGHAITEVPDKFRKWLSNNETFPAVAKGCIKEHEGDKPDPVAQDNTDAQNIIDDLCDKIERHLGE